jgi:aldose sugar dehydrogenase
VGARSQRGEDARHQPAGPGQRHDGGCGDHGIGCLGDAAFEDDPAGRTRIEAAFACADEVRPVRGPVKIDMEAAAGVDVGTDVSDRCNYERSAVKPCASTAPVTDAPDRRRALGAMAGLAAAALIGPSRALGAETVDAAGLRLRLEQVSDRLRDPVALTFDGEGGLLVAEAAGDVAWLRSGRQIMRLTGLPPVHEGREAGLFDLALAAARGRTRRLVLSFARTFALSQSRLSVTASAWSALSGRLTETETLWEESPPRDAARGFGGRLLPAPDGGFYLAAGDRGDREAAVDPTQAAGKIYRLSFTGGPGLTNPRIGENAVRGLWSFGHGNVKALALRPSDGSLWAADDGRGANDTLTRVLGGLRHLAPGEEAPADVPAVAPTHVWDRSTGPAGMAFLAGPRFAAWAGRLVVGARQRGSLRLLTLAGDRVTADDEILRGRLGSISDVRLDAAGSLWVLGRGADGGLWRVYPD